MGENANIFHHCLFTILLAMEWEKAEYPWVKTGKTPQVAKLGLL